MNKELLALYLLGSIGFIATALSGTYDTEKDLCGKAYGWRRSLSKELVSGIIVLSLVPPMPAVGLLVLGAITVIIPVMIVHALVFTLVTLTKHLYDTLIGRYAPSKTEE